MGEGTFCRCTTAWWTHIFFPYFFRDKERRLQNGCQENIVRPIEQNENDLAIWPLCHNGAVGRVLANKLACQGFESCKRTKRKPSQFLTSRPRESNLNRVPIWQVELGVWLLPHPSKSSDCFLPQPPSFLRSLLFPPCQKSVFLCDHKNPTNSLHFAFYFYRKPYEKWGQKRSFWEDKRLTANMSLRPRRLQQPLQPRIVSRLAGFLLLWSLLQQSASSAKPGKTISDIDNPPYSYDLWVFH